MRSLCEPSLEQFEDVSATAVFERASIERAAFIIIRLSRGLPDVFFFFYFTRLFVILCLP